MAWHNAIGKDADTVISSRVRLARNINGYPFASKLDAAGANEIIEKVSAPLETAGFRRINFSGLSPIMATSYVERHYVSPEFATKEAPHTLLLQEASGLAVMVCEEDHLRVQCILPGLSLEDAYRFATDCDDVLDAALPLAYDEKWGYLTHCPTNLGTGMRASVMLFLPALTRGGYVATLGAELSKIGLTLRGLFGEGTAPHGCIYQLSNQVTLGVSEEEIISKLQKAIATVIKKERELRESLSDEEKDRRHDRICRSVGTMRYATLISSEEFFTLFADVKLGVSLGIVTDITHEALHTLLIEAMPATLSLATGSTASDAMTRDKARAARIKKIWEVKTNE